MRSFTWCISFTRFIIVFFSDILSEIISFNLKANLTNLVDQDSAHWQASPLFFLVFCLEFSSTVGAFLVSVILCVFGLAFSERHTMYKIKIRTRFDFNPLWSNADNSCRKHNLTYFCSIQCASSTTSIFILDLVTTTQGRTSFSTTIILSILIKTYH